MTTTINKECLVAILKQHYPEQGKRLAEELWRRGGNSTSALGNLPRKYASPVIYGVSLYEVIDRVVTTINLVGCPDESAAVEPTVGAPPTPVSYTYENVLVAPSFEARPKKVKRGE